MTNRHDKALVVRGLSGRRQATMDSLLLEPGATGEARFTADVEGTYYYWAGEPGVVPRRRIPASPPSVSGIEPNQAP